MQRRTFLATTVLAVVGACTSDDGAIGSLPADRTAVLPSLDRDVGVRLDDVLARRRSIRSFTDRPLDEEAISRLLWAAQGVTASWGGRTAPSAGALYPIEVYVATADALRRYVPDGHHQVELALEDRRPRIAEATGGQEAAADAPTLFVITGVVARTTAKYGDRAQRYVQLEAGHVCQNLLLEATALRLGAVPVGAFSDEAMRDALGLDDGELPLYVVPIGHPVVEG